MRRWANGTAASGVSLGEQAVDVVAACVRPRRHLGVAVARAVARGRRGQLGGVLGGERDELDVSAVEGEGVDAR